MSVIGQCLPYTLNEPNNIELIPQKIVNPNRSLWDDFLQRLIKETPKKTLIKGGLVFLGLGLGANSRPGLAMRNSVVMNWVAHGALAVSGLGLFFANLGHDDLNRATRELGVANANGKIAQKENLRLNEEVARLGPEILQLDGNRAEASRELSLAAERIVPLTQKIELLTQLLESSERGKEVLKQDVHQMNNRIRLLTQGSFEEKRRLEEKLVRKDEEIRLMTVALEKTQTLARDYRIALINANKN